MGRRWQDDGNALFGCLFSTLLVVAVLIVITLYRWVIQ